MWTYNKRVKFCWKILSRWGKNFRKPQGVKFFDSHCTQSHSSTSRLGHNNFIAIVSLLLVGPELVYDDFFACTGLHCGKFFTKVKVFYDVVYIRQAVVDHGLGHFVLKFWAKIRMDSMGSCKLNTKVYEQVAQLSQRPCDVSCHWIFRYVTKDQSRSFETTLLSRACISLY